MSKVSKASLVNRKNGETLARMTIYIPPELRSRLGDYAHEEGLELSAVVASALAAFLPKVAKPEPVEVTAPRQRRAAGASGAGLALPASRPGRPVRWG